MAESTLTLTYTDFAAETARFLGWDDDSSNWSTSEAARLKKVVNSAYRKTLKPQPFPPSRTPHSWSFLRPIGHIDLWDSVTATVCTGTTVVTAASAIFHESMIGHSLVAVTSSTSYTITEYTSSTVVTVDSSIASDSGGTFTITQDGSYRFPDDFGGLIGRPTYDQDNWAPVQYGLIVTNEQRIRAYLQGTTVSNGRPVYCAVRPIGASNTTTTGQRWDMTVYPHTEQDYVVSIKYHRLVNKLDATTNIFPIGAADLGEAILQGCRAEADRTENDNQGHEHTEWLRLLQISVLADQARYSSQQLGEGAGTDDEVYLHRRTSRVSYRGVQY